MFASLLCFSAFAEFRAMIWLYSSNGPRRLRRTHLDVSREKKARSCLSASSHRIRGTQSNQMQPSRTDPNRPKLTQTESSDSSLDSVCAACHPLGLFVPLLWSLHLLPRLSPLVAFHPSTPLLRYCGRIHLLVFGCGSPVVQQRSQQTWHPAMIFGRGFRQNQSSMPSNRLQTVGSWLLVRGNSRRTHC